MCESILNTRNSLEENIMEDDIEIPEKISIIKKTWKELMCNKEEVGQRIYQQVITKNISMSRLFINSTLHKQASLFMQMLDTVIGYLDDLKTMDEKLEELGKIHSLKFGVRIKHYKHFRTAFMKAICVYIPWNTHREIAWLWLWDRMISAMTVYENNNAILPFDISQDTYAKYVAAIRESFDNAIDQSPLEVIKQFHDLLFKEQPTIANLILPKSDCKTYYARLLAMLRYTIRLLDDQEEFQKQINLLIFRYKKCGINEDQLNVVIQTFTRILKQSNNSQWNSMHDESWKWLSQTIVKLFVISSRTSQ